MDLAGRFGMLSVLGLPAAGDVAAVAEVASLTGEGGHKRLAIDGELVRAARKVKRQLADLDGVASGLAREGADDGAVIDGRSSLTHSTEEVGRVPHVKREEELEVGGELLGGGKAAYRSVSAYTEQDDIRRDVRVIGLCGGEGVVTDVEGEAVDTVGLRQ